MENTKSSVGQYVSPAKMKVGSGAKGEWASSADQSHPSWPLIIEISYTGLPVLKATMEMVV
jgi:hypothetical protein